MRKIQNKAFSLVELLVVITILAIISVVAYQNFGWAVDKAVSGRKINDISTIETALQQFKVDNNYYPSVETGSWGHATNKWWYDNTTAAKASNTIKVVYDGEEIDSLASADGGWRVYGSGAWSSKQIWAKGTISRDTLGKKYLSKDLYDPEVWDLKIKSTSNKMIDFGIGRYVYAVYKKSKSSWNWWTSNYSWTNYNLAFTVKESGTDKYVTKIVWDYDEESCFDNKNDCPQTLIGSWAGTGTLIDKQEEGFYNDGSTISNFESDKQNQWIPYAVADFTE